MHFTYTLPSGDLCQGDVLKRTAALENILREAHPHYLAEDYKLFMILTQTCDLVRRKGSCTTRYVEIATVRPIDVAMQRQLQTFQDKIDIRAGACSDKSKDKFSQFVKSLLNNNSNEYFYLRDEAGAGIDTGMCALLRESVPIRASTHYQTLIDARTVSLHPTFQAKLGWTVGHIYSRVATDDWVPIAATEAEFDALASRLTNGACTWVEDRSLRQAKKTITENMNNDEIRERIAGAKSVSKKTEILARVCDAIRENYPDHFPNLKNLQQTLSSDNELKSLFS